MNEESQPQAGRAELLFVLLALALLEWVAVDRLSVWYQVRGASIAAVNSVPPVLFWAPVALAGLGLTGWGVLEVLRHQDPRPARALYILTMLVLLVDAFFLPPVRPRLVSMDGSARAILGLVSSHLGDSAPGEGLANEGGAVMAAWDALVEAGLPPPPYRVEGEPMARWHLSYQGTCEGPVLEPGPHRIGTILYCVAEGRHHGWLTLVGTGGELVGGPALGKDLDGRPVVVEVRR